MSGDKQSDGIPRRLSQTEMQAKLIEDRAISLKAAGKIIARAALDLFATDKHRFSTRPCPTCSAISSLIGERWGCLEFADKEAARKQIAQSSGFER